MLRQPQRGCPMGGLAICSITRAKESGGNEEGLPRPGLSCGPSKRSS